MQLSGCGACLRVIIAMPDEGIHRFYNPDYRVVIWNQDEQVRGRGLRCAGGEGCGPLITLLLNPGNSEQ